MGFTLDRQEMIDRFCSYCRMDTQSSEESKERPSTAKQLDLLRKLEAELKELGISETHFDERGYVYGHIPANLPPDHSRYGKVPGFGLIAHVDTSPSVTGAGVQPLLHENYDGGNLVLPGDPEQVVSPEETPELLDCRGHTVITTDGTTLLGADNKAGIAEIMTLAAILTRNPEILHGPVKIAFTSDEEIGKGAEHFDIDGFGAVAAYTVDGSTVGEIEDETFCADTVTITVHGKNVHPGYAKGKMINAIKLTSQLLGKFPTDGISPETTESREGYIHPHKIEGEEEKMVLHVLIRDFDESGVVEKEDRIREWAREIESVHPGCHVDVAVHASYRNMKMKLDEHPHVVDLALEATRLAGLTPKRNVIRGGTDGAVLTEKGLPTPNIFTGAHNFHSKREWVSVDGMEKTVETLVHLTSLWLERG